MKIEDALPAFVAESEELLRDMEGALLQCAGGERDPELINLIFRSAHTIKGSAGLFGLEHVVSFVHVVETALDLVRQSKLPLSEALVALLLKSKDQIEQLIAHGAAGKPLDAQQRGRALELQAALQRTYGAATAAEASGGPTAAAAAAEPVATVGAWGINVRFGSEVLRSGMDPLGFIRYLKTFGEIRRLQLLQDRLPETSAFDPESCYLGFELELLTSADRARIEGAFEFVRDECTLQLTAPRRRASDAPREPWGKDQAAAAHSVRVDAHKLDTLITRIGELIISAAGTTLAARQAGVTELQERTETLAKLVEQVRESALQLRMVKIGATFNRFQRVVHDVSRELGKEIRLVVHGEDTELDKTVVERIGDPLTHLVRNAIDHGIESSETRAACGKSSTGTLTLNAFHDSGSIVIEVSDDGGGLKRDKILAKALERGLLEEGRTNSDAELFNLIFEPGFSTAEAVTNLSGRGVGMDVVKRNITALRGTVAVRSQEGAGTTITVRLPLTLAIINGFQIGVGNATFVLPLEAIEECVEFNADDARDFIDLRGQVLPFVRLRELFATSAAAPRRQSIVIVRHAAQRVGVVVDSLLGESQTVIKPLGKLFAKADYASGTSILGNGEVALILDVGALIARAALSHAAAAGVQRASGF